ncbi:hypothetical protein CTEN210_16447 [Chaetoceros tenuissimus]|uniref:Reverse transcriptase domain-containing protein n=1 Tax=Chaetoceros tenuissimus TaxID=426638 RepID=A0AAD3HE50_9STRA|nr:hypothetical protein CTEN210_16447 [Chaetoceros tenuissimus]
MVLADQGYPTKGKSKEVHVIVEDVEDEPACKKAKLSPSPIIQPRAQTPQSIDRAIEEAFQSDESFPDEITELQEEIGKYIGLMRPRGEALKHPAATMLEEFAIKGCPVNCGEDWTEKHIIEAIRRGAHPSAKKLAAIRELRKEAFDKVHGGYARIIKFGKIRHQLPKKLKISPIAAIPHKSRLFRFILDLSFQLLVDGERMPSVNSSTNKTAQQQSMSQLGQAIKRIINTMAQARKKDPAQRFHFAKLDIKDGFWRLAVSDEEAWNFCYVLPSENGEVDLDEVEIVVPNSLQMGWAESPPFFCSASETGRDIIEQLLTEESLPAHQMESLMFEEKFVYGVAAKDTINLVEVFVDDYIAITNDTSRANILHLSRAMLHGIHSVFPPTAITGHNGEDPIAQKKLLAGEGIWQEEKEILGWIIHGGKYTISLPPEKLQTLRNLVQKYKRAKKKKTDLNSWQKLAGKLMHASFGIVGGRSLMSPIWKAMEGSPAYINITEDLKQCLSDWKSIITSILKRPSDISLLVADTPDYNGYLDALEWPEDIKQKLDTHEVTINDLELAAIVLEWFAAEAIIPNMYNIRLGMFCDNTSAVSWAQHGCTSTSAVAGQLLRLLYMRINTKEAGPALVTNVAGDDNTMADIASRAFRDDELLARTHYTKRVGVARDILSSWSYIGNGVTAKNEKERAKYWKAWCSYCCSICIDPFLRGESQLQATIAVAAFAARVRTGSYGLGEQVTVQTVTKAISAITKTIKLAGERSPILTTEGQYTTPIGRLVEGMRREDPPPVAKLAVPVEVVHEAHDMSTTTNCPRTQATADLMVIAFYYLLRVGEYTKPTRVKRNGKWVRATRTVQFTVGNIGFKDIHGKDISRHSSLEKLLQAHSVTMKITNQKNGHMGTTIHHEDTGAKTSPTKALARRVHHILANGGDTDSLLCDFYDEASDTFSSVQAQHVRDMVKAMVVKLNLTEKGITPDLVGTHSLRAGGAMALKLHGYDDTTIMKMGRWTSLTFTMYIHNQIAHLSAGVSRKMGEKLPFINIAAIEK